MNVQRALTLLPPDAVLTAETRSNYYGSSWVVWATYAARECPDHGDAHGLSWCDIDGCDRPTCSVAVKEAVTHFASADVFSAAHFIASFDRCRHRA